MSRQVVLLAMDFSDRLSTLCKTKGLTQQALAELVRVHVAQIRRYEGGDSQPTLDVIEELIEGMIIKYESRRWNKAVVQNLETRE